MNELELYDANNPLRRRFFGGPLDGKFLELEKHCDVYCHIDDSGQYTYKAFLFTFKVNGEDQKAWAMKHNELSDQELFVMLSKPKPDTTGYKVLDFSHLLQMPLQYTEVNGVSVPNHPTYPLEDLLKDAGEYIDLIETFLAGSGRLAEFKKLYKEIQERKAKGSDSHKG